MKLSLVIVSLCALACQVGCSGAKSSSASPDEAAPAESSAPQGAEAESAEQKPATAAASSATTPQARMAPAFALADFAGKQHSLAELTANGPAVLVFYRGHW